jgi:hypothetical protein
MTLLNFRKPSHIASLLAFTAIFAIPDTILELLLEMSHLSLELIHILFELFEMALDHLVEHVFETERRQTQIIVFYLMVAIALGGAYYLSGIVMQYWRLIKAKIMAGFHTKKNRLSVYWAESAANKFMVIASFHGALFFIFLLTSLRPA